jgi:hypothetical protein
MSEPAIRAPQFAWTLLAALATQTITAAQPPRTDNTTDTFEGYDFEQVVQRVETSVNPLEQEMAGSFQAFAESVATAEQLLAENRPAEAVQACSAAIDQVVAGRENVLRPMWEGQAYLAEQIGQVRTRLASAVAAAGGSTQTRLDERAERMLDGIASRIAAEPDPRRKKRLVTHYRTIRQLAQIKQMALQLSPNQRKLWQNVLRVLEDTALAHQQVLMGTEVLFAQFQATAMNLKEYEELIRTVDGAARLLGVARGLGQSGHGLTRLTQSMSELQERLAGMNQHIEQVLNVKMIDLETQVDTVTAAASSDAGTVSTDIDAELARRLQRLSED